MPIKSGQIDKPRLSLEFEATEHFIGGVTNPVSGGGLNTGVVFSGGSAVYISSAVNTPGVARLSTSVAATGGINLRSLTTALILPTVGIFNYRCKFRYRIPSTIINPTETASWVLGFGNGNGAGEPAYGAYLYFNNVEGIQYFVTKASTNRTAISNILQPVNTWLECFISLLKDNTVKFEIQNQEGDSAFSTFFSNTNIPLNNALGIQFGVAKSAGSLNRQLDLDYISFGFDTY